MSDFLNMGGYAAYVWSAYGLTLVVLVANIFAARARHQGAIRTLRGRLRRERRHDDR